MKRAAVISAITLVLGGFLILLPAFAQAHEPIVLAKADDAQLLSDKELGAITGGELGNTCGVASQKCSNQQGPRTTQIILWDERGPLGRPPQNSQGMRSTGNGRSTFESHTIR